MLFRSVEHEKLESGDWTAEDDRLVLVGRIADVIESMPADKLAVALEAGTGIRDLD